MKQTLLCLILVGLCCANAPVAFAHDGRPLFIDVREAGADSVRLAWKAPPVVSPDNAPLVSLAGCNALRQSRVRPRLAGAELYSCENGVAGKSLTMDYPLFNPAVPPLVRVEFADGETRSSILEPDVREWVIPAPETFAGVVRDYFVLGMEHIFGGMDHLLFLAGLLYIARTPRRILITVTGFTLAHSVTLFLVALDVLRVSVPAVETVIALSIVMLASEIGRNDRTTLTWRRPLLVAGGFGLVHGAGFAAALMETGLPQTEKISALLFFNLGVEAGQLLIITAIFTGLRLLVRLPGPPLPAPDTRPLRLVFSYALGIVSTFWFIERLTASGLV